MKQMLLACALVVVGLTGISRGADEYDYDLSIRRFRSRLGTWISAGFMAASIRLRGSSCSTGKTRRNRDFS